MDNQAPKKKHLMKSGILRRFIKTGLVEKVFLDGSFIELITPQP
jgi:hypothetical protein